MRGKRGQKRRRQTRGGSLPQAKPIQQRGLDGQWYRLTESFVDGEPQKLMEITVEDGQARPILLQAQFFDEKGERILMVANMNMEGVPPKVVENTRRLLQAQNITPTLILPEVIKLLRLVSVSKVEANRIMGDARRSLAEVQAGTGPDEPKPEPRPLPEVADPVKPTKPSLLIVPGN